MSYVYMYTYLICRGEYFYFSRVAPLGIIFFLRAEIFNLKCFVQKYSKLWCIVQKYWSGIFTCYTVITIDYLDLTTFSGMLPEAMKNEVKQ